MYSTQGTNNTDLVVYKEATQKSLSSFDSFQRKIEKSRQYELQEETIPKSALKSSKQSVYSLDSANEECAVIRMETNKFEAFIPNSKKKAPFEDSLADFSDENIRHETELLLQ